MVPSMRSAAGRDAVYAADLSRRHRQHPRVQAHRPTATGATRCCRCPQGGSASHRLDQRFRAGGTLPLRELHHAHRRSTPTRAMTNRSRSSRCRRALMPRNLATEQFYATSKDGTRVPYFVTRAASAHRPGADDALRLWRLRDLDDAVLFGELRHAVARAWRASMWCANIRGGGEFGPAWHQAALLENRQQAYRRFPGGGARSRASAASPRPSSSASWAAPTAGCW